MNPTNTKKCPHAESLNDICEMCSTRPGVPTVEQWQAAKETGRSVEALAFAFAGREAQLRAENERLLQVIDNLKSQLAESGERLLERAMLRAHVETLTKERDTALAEKRAILTGIGADGADDETAALIVQLRARVAEWEVQHGIDRASIASMVESIKRYRGSEAQHLADILALRDAAKHGRRIVGAWVDYCAHDEDVDALAELDDAIGRTNHYDDAKADAPAVVVTGIPATATLIDHEALVRRLNLALRFHRDEGCGVKAFAREVGEVMGIFARDPQAFSADEADEAAAKADAPATVDGPLTAPAVFDLRFLNGSGTQPTPRALPRAFCPYPGLHAADCDCGGEGGAR